MGAQVAVAEPEPLRLHAVCRELALEQVALVGPAPALLLVDAAAEGVEHGVQIRAHPQPEKGDVVAGVPDDGHGAVGERGGPVEVGQEAAQESGSAHAAGQGSHTHGGSLSARHGSPVPRPRRATAVRGAVSAGFGPNRGSDRGKSLRYQIRLDETGMTRV